MTDLPINQVICGDAIESLKGLPLVEAAKSEKGLFDGR